MLFYACPLPEVRQIFFEIAFKRKFSLLKRLVYGFFTYVVSLHRLSGKSCSLAFHASRTYPAWYASLACHASHVLRGMLIMLVMVVAHAQCGRQVAHVMLNMFVTHIMFQSMSRLSS